MWSDDLICRGVLKLHQLHPTPFVRCEILNFRIPLSEQVPETCMVHQYGKGDG